MYVKIRVNPQSRDNKVTRLGADKFTVAVREKAANNLANKQALNLLAQHLKVPPANLRIISGHKAPHKIVYIRQ